MTSNDVTEVVLSQHKDVAARLSAVLNKTGSDRSEEFESLAEFLAVHEAAEESVIYPALRKLGDERTRIADDRTTRGRRGERCPDQAQGLRSGFSRVREDVHRVQCQGARTRGKRRGRGAASAEQHDEQRAASGDGPRVSRVAARRLQPSLTALRTGPPMVGGPVHGPAGTTFSDPASDPNAPAMPSRQTTTLALVLRPT